jgi:hypothetical protein
MTYQELRPQNKMEQINSVDDKETNARISLINKNQMEVREEEAAAWEKRQSARINLITNSAAILFIFLLVFSGWYALAFKKMAIAFEEKATAVEKEAERDLEIIDAAHLIKKVPVCMVRYVIYFLVREDLYSR